MFLRLKSIILILVILAASISWLFLKTDTFKYINGPSDKPVIVFPAIENRIVIKKDFENRSLARELNQFILDGSEAKILRKLVYVSTNSSNSDGLEISYKLNSKEYNINDFYTRQTDVIKNSGWNFLAGNIEKSKAFLEADYKKTSATYQVRIAAEEKETYLEVNIQFLINYD